MKHKNLLFSTLFFLITITVFSQERKEIAIPNIPGFVTLKCDFHIHTVFSDGNVWPTVRVKEAWTEGLDAIAITDHIEYRPHSKDITTDHNRSFELAKPMSEQLGIILIKGSEITRKMPPGHLNAIFLTNSNLLEKEDWFDACQEAKKQGAFIFWNHPGWRAQQPEKTLWWEEHTKLLTAGLLDGIEVYNTNEFFPEALVWVKEKGLTIMSSSDVHDPMSMVLNENKTHRPLTLVFASDKSEQSIKKALISKQTAAYYGNILVGDKAFLSPIFSASIEIKSPLPNLENKKSFTVQVHNHSDLDFIMKQSEVPVEFKAPQNITLKAHHTVAFRITGTSDEVKNMKYLKMNYKVENLIIGPDELLPVVLEIQNL